ncbi:MAG: Hvo_1808 family surface protein [Haloarculaceae archaeon]
MRTFLAVVLGLLVVLAGCSAPVAQPSSGQVGGTPAATATPARAQTPDPPTDRLGWEDGYWYNDTLSIDRSDGINDSEREAIVARTMARVEHIRHLEFETTVPVDVVSRSAYRQRAGGGSGAGNGTRSPAFRRFDNAKFEALFFVGESGDSIATQDANRGSNVLGYYSPASDSIVVVEGENADLPRETTLAHELVHALQDQHFGLGNYSRSTRESYNAVNGLIEGDARYVGQRYRNRCGAQWSCFAPQSASQSQGQGKGQNQSQPSVNFGIYFLNYFPYSDGPGFVARAYDRGGWDAVDALYDRPPASTEQVIDPQTYPDDLPSFVKLTDRTGDGWTRVRPSEAAGHRVRPDYAILGRSALSSMFAYTFVDGTGRPPVVTRDQFVNYDPDGTVNGTDPFNYDLRYTSGWDGDRLHVYQKDGETAYVWRLAWDSPADAREFASGYRRLLAHHGGERVGTDTWRIDDGPFADAFRVRVQGDTVTIVNAPTVDALDAVRRPR